MQDGQSASGYHPDRAEEDAQDLELEDETKSEIEARTTSLGLGFKKPGESDSSVKRFMAEWSSDSDPLGDLGAESEPAEQTLPKGKRPRPDDAGPSKIAKKKGKTGTRRAAPEISGPVLSPTPLNIARPGFFHGQVYCSTSSSCRVHICPSFSS